MVDAQYLLEAAALIAEHLHVRVDVEGDTMLYLQFMQSRAVEIRDRKAKQGQ